MTVKTLSKALKYARISVFAALYACTSLIPISMFIGAPSFLALNLIITPTIAILLSPKEALLSAFLGGVIALYISPSQAMFGPFTILLPTLGATLGSLAYHKPRAGFFISAYLLAVSASYLISRTQFPYWILPHIFAAISLITLSITKSQPKRIKIPLYAFISTMCEQGTMLLGAVYILSLPWTIFATAFPLMLYERIIATLGSSLIALGFFNFKLIIAS